MIAPSAARAPRCTWRWTHRTTLLPLRSTLATTDDRTQVGQLAQAVRVVTGRSVPLAYVDQGHTGDEPAEAARARGIALAIVRLSRGQARLRAAAAPPSGRALLAWSARLCRLARDDGRLPQTLAGLHLVAFATLMLTGAVVAFDSVHNSF